MTHAEPDTASDAVTALYEEAVALRERHAFGPARQVVQRLLGRLRRGGAGVVDIARVLLLRAGLDAATGAGTRALRSFTRAVLLLAPHRRDLDAVRLRVQAACGAAHVHLERGDYAAARAAYRMGLRLAQRRLGPDDDDTLAALTGLGVVGKYTAQFGRAAACYQRVLAALTARGSDADPAMLATLHHNLGGLEHARGRPAHGEPHARRSVALREALLGPDHPDVAADLAALAALLDAQDKFDEAEALYLRALAIFRRTYGPGHYECCVTYNNLGALAHRRGDLRAAKRLYTRALVMKERLLGAHHPDVAISLANLGVLHADAGRFDAAIQAQQRALKIFRRHLPERHPSVQDCLVALRAAGKPLASLDQRASATRG